MPGRHRAPQQSQYARDIAVITTVTTAGLAPWFYPNAQAATQEEWNKVAQCESSGNWHINTKNGYFGGLQFLQSTWREFGGLQFAARADLATPNQQMQVAERVLKVQGKGAWPVCGRGLSTSTSPAPNTNREPESNPAPRRAPNPSPKTPPSSSDNAGSFYTVAPGDTLSAIASRFKTCATKLAKLNNISNPDLIYAGTRLRITSAVAPSSSSPAQIKPESNQSTTSSTPTLPKQSQSQRLVAAARTYLGTPYLYGGTTRRGIDCSALVQNSFAQLGKSVPRTADAQMRASRIVDRESITPGTLAFSLTSKGRAYHVAIYIGNGLVLEAPQTGKVVSIRPLYSALTRFGQLL